MPNNLNKFTKLSLKWTILILVPNISMSSKKLYIYIGPVMLWKMLVLSMEFKSKLDLIHYMALFKNLLNAHGDAFHPKVKA